MGSSLSALYAAYPLTSIATTSVCSLLFLRWWFKPRLLDSYFKVDEAKFYDLQFVGKHSSQIPMEDIPKCIAEMKHVFRSNITRRVSNRKRQLQKLLLLLEENEDQIVDAIRADLGRCKFLSLAYDVLVTKSDIRNLLQHVDSWSAPQRFGMSLLTFPSWEYHVMEPYGTVFVNGIWNFPFQLALNPIASAIAAGNNVIFKPCSTSKQSALLLSDLLHRYMDPKFVQVLGHPTVGDDYAVTDKILDQRFDLIFFTGSTNGGKYIMKRAAANLTPVVLELGGKNPVIIDDSADLGSAARQIVNARVINGGQQCISPDYVLCYERCVDALIENAVKYMRAWYKSGERMKEDLGQSQGKLVNAKQLERVQGMLQLTDGEVVYGGKWDDDTNMMEPTIVRLNSVQHLDAEKTIHSETFGPILWIVPIPNKIEAAVSFLNEKMEKPLSLYLFSTNKQHQNYVIHNTSSGGVQVNGVLTYSGNHNASFGGVGHSGMGSYHGKHSFDTFSHKKPAVVSYLEPPFGLIYPPYDAEWKTKVMRWVLG